MSAMATRPDRAAGSVRAPPCNSFFGTDPTWNWRFVPMKSPGVPFWIRFLATSTVAGALELLTLLRYECRYATSTIAASTAAAPPMKNDPRLVVNRFWAISTTGTPPLFRHDCHAGVEASDDARLGTGSGRAVGDVRDEIAGKVPGRNVRDGIR